MKSKRWKRKTRGGLCISPQQLENSTSGAGEDELKMPDVIPAPVPIVTCLQRTQQSWLQRKKHSIRTTQSSSENRKSSCSQSLTNTRQKLYLPSQAALGIGLEVDTDVLSLGRMISQRTKHFDKHNRIWTGRAELFICHGVKLDDSIITPTFRPLSTAS